MRLLELTFRRSLMLAALATLLCSRSVAAAGCAWIPANPFDAADCVVVGRSLVEISFEEREVVLLRVERAAKGCRVPIIPILTSPPHHEASLPRAHER